MMNLIEYAELRKHMNGLLRKNFFRERASPCAVPALLTPKKDDKLRMCVNSHVINMITVKYMFFIYRLDNLLDMMARSNIYLRLTFVVGITRSVSAREMSRRMSL